MAVVILAPTLNYDGSNRLISVSDGRGNTVWQFAYVGATFASTQYSIYALLWVLLGGVGTTLGPLVGTALMFYLVDFTSEITSSYLIVVGVVLVLLVLVFPKGVIGTLRESWRGGRS